MIFTLTGLNRLKIMPLTNQVPCFSSADANII
jgi:hypothetical protein